MNAFSLTTADKAVGIAGSVSMVERYVRSVDQAYSLVFSAGEYIISMFRPLEGTKAKLHKNVIDERRLGRWWSA